MNNLHRVTVQCGIVAFTSGSLIGFSTVLESLNEALKPPEGANAVNSSHGTNAYVLAFALSGFISLAISRYGQGRPFIIWTLLAFTALSTALSILFCVVAQSTKTIAVLYLCAVPLMAMGLAGLIYSNNVVAVGQWVKRGRPEIGASVVGGTQGLGTLAFTVLPGVLVAASETWGLYYYTAMLCFFGLLGAGLALGRWFVWPGEEVEEAGNAAPPLEGMKYDGRGHEADPDKVSPATVAAAEAEADDATNDDRKKSTGIVTETVDVEAPQSHHGSNATGAEHGGNDEGRNKDEVLSALSFLVTPDGFLYSSLYIGIYFAGIGAKGILTAMFLLIFPAQVTFLGATVLATVSLIAYAVVRTIFPFLVKVVPIHLTFGAVNLTGAVLFGILPWLLANDLNEFGFTAILSVTGAVYAIGATLLPLVGAVYFEPKLFPLAAGTASALSPYGSAAGIAMSWYLAQDQQNKGTGTAAAAESTAVFNPTFYMFAVVYTLNAVILGYFFCRGRSNLVLRKGERSKEDAAAAPNSEQNVGTVDETCYEYP